jgi:dTDP-4-amino-4,6-dideoxygalactose transaminase
MPELAALGGPKLVASGTVGSRWPIYGDAERRQLEEVLGGEVWGATGLGPKIDALNALWAEYCGTRRSVALANGTVTMELALRALGVGPGAEVIVPAWTFMATAIAVLNVGAVPVFVDIEQESLCMSPQEADAAVSDSTRAMIPVHYGGHPCDMDQLMEVARRRDLVVIEDAAQAHGAIWGRRKMGAFGDCGSYSFQQSKNLQCGEGGSIVTDDHDLADRIHFSLSKFGRGKGASHHPFTHYELAGNANMTEFQAAITLAQLTRLEEQTERRANGAQLLRSLLSGIDGIDPLAVDARVDRHGYHLFLCRYHEDAFEGLCKGAVASALTAEGVPCTSLYERPLYEEPMYDLDHMAVRGSYLRIRTTPCPQTEEASRNVVAFPQTALLAEPTELELLPLAIQKVQANAGELVRAEG